MAAAPLGHPPYTRRTGRRRRSRRGAKARSGSKCSSRASSEETMPSSWPAQSRQVPCYFQSFNLRPYLTIAPDLLTRPRIAAIALDRPAHRPWPRIQSTLVVKTLLEPTCKRTKLKEPVRSAISWNSAIENSRKDLYRDNSVMPSKSLRPALLSSVTKCTLK